MVWVIIGIVAFAFLMLICSAKVKIDQKKQEMIDYELKKREAVRKTSKYDGQHDIYDNENDDFVE